MTIPNAPQVIQPAVEGRLSSSPTPTYKVRYSNPRGSADPAGQFRMLVTRSGTEAGGFSQTSLTAWDSGWVGQPTITALPLGLRGAGVSTWNGRVYVTGGDDAAGNRRSEVWSASFQGASVGAWRAERPMEVIPGSGPSSRITSRSGHACTCANFIPNGLLLGSANPGGNNPWLLIYGGVDEAGQVTGHFFGAPILGDGTLGPWTTIQNNSSPLAYHDLLPIPSISLTSALVLTGGTASVGGIPTKQVWCAPIMAAPLSGTQWNFGWVQGPDMLFQMYGHFTAYDPAYGTLYCFRGHDGTNTYIGQQLVLLAVDAISGKVFWGGSWSGSGVTGTARNNPAGAYFPAQSVYSNAFMLLFGGSSTSSHTTALTSVEESTITPPAGPGLLPTIGSWATTSSSLPVASALATAVVGQFPPNAQYNLQTEAFQAKIGLFGGGNGTTPALTNVYTTTCNPLGGDIAAWRGGATGSVGAGLSSGNLGTGGSVAADTSSDAPAGAQLLTVVHGATSSISQPLVDGDSGQITTWTIDKLGGDVSPPTYRSFRIGQAPSISSVSPANAGLVGSGQPTISFAYSSGIGGGAEFSWQAQVKQGSTVLFDSGVRYDQSNAVTASLAPLLPASQASSTYTLFIQVWSGDISTTGSVITTTSTTTFGTSAFSVPGTPTGLGVGLTSAAVNLSWSAVSGATGYRLYHRRTGSASWILLTDSIAGTSYVAMDHVAVGVPYDFAVSALNGTPAESGLSTPQSATIASGNFTHYLHVATQGTSYGVPLQVQGTPSMALKQDAHSFSGFNQAAPVTRYGSGEFHQVSFEGLILDPTPATLKLLQQVMGQVRAGGVACLRDALGGQIVCTFDADQSVSIKGPFYRAPSLKLTEVADTVGPYLASGSAVGYPSFAAGRRLPLDSSERLI